MDNLTLFGNTSFDNKLNIGSKVNNVVSAGKKAASLFSKDDIVKSLKNAVKTGLFMEAMRNLNWSRGYLWYVELDGVPSPFQRGGVLGLPCTSVTYDVTSQASSKDIQNTGMKFNVPTGFGGYGTINLTMYDDEQGTLRQFFERWHNQIYNPFYGAIPITEAVKQLSIFHQKSTRRNVKRVWYDMDKSMTMPSNTNPNVVSSKEFKWGNVINDIKAFGKSGNGNEKVYDSTDFLVYPSGNINVQLNNSGSELITITVTLQVAQAVTQDFGNPLLHTGAQTLFNKVIGISDGTSWIDKIGDYI